MKILVTGAAGYAGSEVLKYLSSQGKAVVGIDNLMYGQTPSREVIVQGDILDEEFIDTILPGFDAVVHLAAIVGDGACAHDPTLARLVNVEGTRLLVEKCKEHGVRRFLFASTCSVYGFNDHPCTEESPVRPLSHYARLKREAETIVLAERTEEFRPVVLRLSSLFGLSARMRFDLAINAMTARATYEKKLEIHGGKQWRPFLAVGDLARVIELMLEREGFEHSIYNIGWKNQNVPFNALKQYFREVFPGLDIHTHLDKVDSRTYRVDFSRFAREFELIGFTTITQGIRTMRDFLLRHPLDWRATRYSNLKMVQRHER